MKTYYVILNGRSIAVIEANSTSAAHTWAVEQFGTAVTVSTIKPEPTVTETAKAKAIVARTSLGRWLQSVGSRLAAI